MALSSLRYGSVAKNDPKKDIRETTETSVGFDSSLRKEQKNKDTQGEVSHRKLVVEHLKQAKTVGSRSRMAYCTDRHTYNTLHEACCKPLSVCEE
jgi:hypothetical protein